MWRPLTDSWREYRASLSGKSLNLVRNFGRSATRVSYNSFIFAVKASSLLSNTMTCAVLLEFDRRPRCQSVISPQSFIRFSFLARRTMPHSPGGLTSNSTSAIFQFGAYCSVSSKISFSHAFRISALSAIIGSAL